MWYSQTNKQVNIHFQSYWYFRQIWQMNNIWVYWYVDPTISFLLCYLYNPWMLILLFDHLSLGDEVIKYMSNKNVLRSWIMIFLKYHANWCEVLSNLLCILHLYNSANVSVEVLQRKTTRQTNNYWYHKHNKGVSWKITGTNKIIPQRLFSSDLACTSIYRKNVTHQRTVRT